MKEFALRWLQKRLEYRDLWALRDVNFQAGREEIFGALGANSAGTTTLLKVIARVLHPTEGRVRVEGSVAPILEHASGEQKAQLAAGVLAKAYFGEGEERYSRYTHRR